MQISSSYSMSGVPYDIKHRNGNVPQFNAEQAVKESENTNRYMPEADFDEKAFAMIGPNAPQDVKDAWNGFYTAYKRRNFRQKNAVLLSLFWIL